MSQIIPQAGPQQPVVAPIPQKESKEKTPNSIVDFFRSIRPYTFGAAILITAGLVFPLSPIATIIVIAVGILGMAILHTTNSSISAADKVVSAVKKVPSLKEEFFEVIQKESAKIQDLAMKIVQEESAKVQDVAMKIVQEESKKLRVSIMSFKKTIVLSAALLGIIPYLLNKIG